MRFNSLDFVVCAFFGFGLRTKISSLPVFVALQRSDIRCPFLGIEFGTRFLVSELDVPFDRIILRIRRLYICNYRSARVGFGSGPC